MKAKRKNVTKILQITKLLITDNEKCIKYLNNEDNQIIRDQLPLLAESKSNFVFSNHQLQLCRNMGFKHNCSSNNNKSLYSGVITSSKAFNNLFKYKRKPTSLMKKSSSGILFSRYCTRLTNRMVNDYLVDDQYQEETESLKYDESEIFHKTNYYDKVMMEKMNKFKSQNDINGTYELKRVLNEGYLRESVLTLTSINIKYTNTETNDVFSFNIPFALVPLFYHQSKDNHLLILLSITKFKDNFKTVIIDIAEFYNLIQKNSKYTNETEERIPTHLKTISFKQERQVVKTQTSIIDSPHNPIYNPAVKLPERLSSKKQTQILPLHYIYPNQEQNKEAIKILNKTYTNSNHHIYKYLWLTPVSSFSVEVIMPRINISFQSLNLSINKFIDSELILYIYIKEFIRWDFYVLHYLFSYKKFRNIIDTLSSKKSSNETGLINQNINISDIRIKKYSKDDLTWKGCYTNERFENNLLKIKMITLDIKMGHHTVKVLNITPYKVHFSYNQSLFLSIASKRVDILNFIMKFIDIDQNKIIFDYIKFDSVTETNIQSQEHKSTLKPLLKLGLNDKSKLDITFKQAKIILSPLVNNYIGSDLDIEKEFEFEQIEQINPLLPYNFGGVIRAVLAREATRPTIQIDSRWKTSKNVISPFLRKKQSQCEIINITHLQLEN